MPTLNWIGKDAVVNHHHQVPFHLLKDVPDLACGEPGDGNLIVEGDNLVALKALLPYAGQVKCIYIDPPYNTGNEGWAYNDNVNSPVIRQWLGQVVGKEGETLDSIEDRLREREIDLAQSRRHCRSDESIRATFLARRKTRRRNKTTTGNRRSARYHEKPGGESAGIDEGNRREAATIQKKQTRFENAVRSRHEIPLVQAAMIPLAASERPELTPQIFFC